MTETVLATLEAALAFGDTLVIVRSGAAIAEVAGGPLRRGDEWLTLGDETAGASHVHVKASAIHALRFRCSEGRNAALDVLDAGGGVVFSVSFRRTNRGRGETFEAGRLAALQQRFGEATGAPA